MDRLIDRICFPSKYIEIEYNKWFLIINFDNSRSRRLSEREYKMFCQLKHKNKIVGSDKNDDFDRKEYNEFIAQMIMSGLVALTPFSKKDIGEDQTKPISVYWGVSSECNFRCKYCYANCGPITDSKSCSYLTDIDYKNIIDKIKKHGFSEILFTGGEPLLNKDVFDMAAYAKEVGLACSLLTNGSLIKKYDINRFKVFNYVKISLDSTIKSVNDDLRGEGSYELIMAAIRRLRDNDIKVDVGTVITNKNKDNLEELIRYLYTEFDVKVHTLANHIPLGRGSSSELNCTFDEIEKCDEVIYNTKMDLARNGLYSVVQDAFLPQGRKISCGMAHSEIYINEKGDVYPCRMTYDDEFYLGNILQENFDVILKRGRKLTSAIHVDNLEGCKDCNYRYLCGGGCRMYHKSFTGSVYRNYLPLCETYKRQLINLLLFKNGMLDTK